MPLAEVPDGARGEDAGEDGSQSSTQPCTPNASSESSYPSLCFMTEQVKLHMTPACAHGQGGHRLHEAGRRA